MHSTIESYMGDCQSHGFLGSPANFCSSHGTLFCLGTPSETPIWTSTHTGITECLLMFIPDSMSGGLFELNPKP